MYGAGDVHSILMAAAKSRVCVESGARARRGEPRGSWRPTLFEQELIDSGTSHIMARVRHPQTNGKTGRFFRTLEEEIGHGGSVARFIEHCNEDRLHFALDIDSGEVPLQAFGRRRAGPEARAANPKWMEEGPMTPRLLSV